VTVDLENSRTGGSVATKTLPARRLDEAACVVAGYVAQKIFSEDPTAPPWCYGISDGSDLAVLLSSWQDRIYSNSSADIRDARFRQMAILERGASSSVCAGVTRYELAHLRDLNNNRVEALRLHAINREQYPRFYRGRYRLGMSLEMIANPEITLADDGSKETLCECLSILDRCRVTNTSICRDDIRPGEPLPRPLRMELLAAAQDELGAVRRQLTLWHLIWEAFVHRDERAIWKHYWRLTERQRFRDGVRVAELVVAVRQNLNEKEGRSRAQPGSSQGPPDTRRDERSGAEQKHQGGHVRKVSYSSRRVMNIYNLARARWITAAITGDSATIKAVLKSKVEYQPDENTQPPRHTQRTRWLPWQRSTPSWPAAYNTACLYAALAGKYDKDTMARRVVTSLTRAINDRNSEMGRPSDWIGADPDFSSVRSTHSFKTFFDDLWQRDNPEVNSVPVHR
jgi:hypothetical protein